MRFLLLLFCSFATAISSVAASTPQQIIDTFSNLTSQAVAIIPKLQRLYDPNVQATEQDVQGSKMPLDALEVQYIKFAADVVSTPAANLNTTTTDALSNAAQEHSKAFSDMGVALARGLPTYEKYGHDLYVAGCKDGVTIGLDALIIFTALGLKFPGAITTLVVQGILEVVRVPLGELRAAECFVPVIPPL
ncbi:hypothetical protein R3P38DRAFT_2766674 [Favolaschia claudopus]|uniref:Uncharacterized protein n=1 Tax=Favolaschia claudopus TaxID=2862362 RepID=A0AAW0D2G5_9AGAR